MASKPHVYRGDHLEHGPWFGPDKTPLFYIWCVSYSMPAPCGHRSCGEDYISENFPSWEEAMSHALSLSLDT